MLGGLTVILAIALFVYAFVAFTEGELAWLASHVRLSPWLEGVQRALARLTAPAKELVAHVWPDSAGNDFFAANMVGLGSLVLALLLVIASLRAFA
jgi:hypothetical protein